MAQNYERPNTPARLSQTVSLEAFPTVGIVSGLLDSEHKRIERQWWPFSNLLIAMVAEELASKF